MGRKCIHPEYDPERVLREMIFSAKECYEKSYSYRYVATELDLSVSKVIKLLITGGVYDSDICRDINKLFNSGKTVAEIQKKLNVSKATVQAYLPYKKGLYNAKECSRNAERIKKYRVRQRALRELAADMCEEKLWEAVVAFQGYTFGMDTGERYTYEVLPETDRTGITDVEACKGIIVYQGKNMIVISWESVLSVFKEITRAKLTGVKCVDNFMEIGKEEMIYNNFAKFGIL